jgi:PKD repeat protein
MKKASYIFPLLAILSVFIVSIHSYFGLEIFDVNAHGIIFNTKTKIPKPDRMDLAWQQEFELTKDLNLNIVPRERLKASWAYQQELFSNQFALNKAAIPGVTWVERGPKNCGGRTRSLMVDLNDPTKKTVWACAVAGGIWKTTDITAAEPNWSTNNDFFQNLAITHIDQAPNKPQVMYFCTGEGNGNLDAVRGLGVWKSINGGKNWNQLPSTNNSSFHYCQKMISLGIGDTVMVLTKAGIFRSINGGTNFTKVLGSGFSTAGNNAYDIEIMKNGTMYATMSNGASNGGTIHKSYNAGASWSAPLPLPNYMPGDEMEIAVSEVDTNNLYVLVESNSRISGLLRTTNAGLSFDSLATFPIDADKGVSRSTFPRDFSRSQAWYDLSLAVDPNNVNVVVVGGVDLFKTANGGNTWNQISHWTGGFGFQNVHADQHYAYFEPGSSSVCYFGNDGGIYRSTNFTQTMPTIQTKEINYNTTQFYACDIHPTIGSNKYLAGAQDNGSHSFNNPGVGNSVGVTGGDGAFCHIDQDQPQFWFTSYVYTSYYRSSNGGLSFSNVLNTGSVQIGSFISPSDYDDLNNRMYLAGNNGFFVRWNNPQTGNSITYDTVSLFAGGRVTHVKVSPNVSNRVYFGLNNGRIVKVDNSNISDGIDSVINLGKGMSTGNISCVEVETGNENHIIATSSNYGVNSVWETKNGGQTWASVEGNLPDMPIRWALFNPNNPIQVMLATELGVWTTDSLRETNTNWQPSNNGFANVRSDMLKLRASDKQVVVATHGRGIYTSNIFSQSAVDFSVDKRVAYVGSKINFTGIAQGATSYEWEFGDGTTSNLQNPIKEYNAAGIYAVKLSINAAQANQIKDAYIQVLPSRGVPYLASNGGDFESNVNDFGPEVINGIGFERGNSIVIGKDGVASGINAWVTSLSSYYPINNHARLFTPSFNFTKLGNYTLSFKVKNQFEIDYDGFNWEYSLNTGDTWTILENTVQANWYDYANNDSTKSTAFSKNLAFFNTTNSGYAKKQIDVSALAGNPKVCFRVIFKSDSNNTHVGMAIDDFEITGTENNPLGVKNETAKMVNFTYAVGSNSILIDSKQNNLSLTIWSQSGQIIQRNSVNNGNNSIELANLARGIYLLEFTDSMGNKQVEKLLWLGQ